MEPDHRVHAEEVRVDADVEVPEVGLADLLDADRVLGLTDEELPLVAEMLDLRPRLGEAPREVTRRRPAPGQEPVGGVRPGRGRKPPEPGPEPDIPSAERSLPVAITERMAEQVEAPVATRPLRELLVDAPGPPPPPEGLFARSTKRALLRGVTAVRAPEGDLDVDAAVDVLAANRTIEELPYEWIETTHGEVQLLLDVGPSMEPYREDVDRLPRELVRIIGDEELELRWFEDCPLGAGGVLLPDQLEAIPFVFPKARTRLLAVTAFGTRGPFAPPREIVRSWRTFAARCRRNGVPLLVLTPLAPERRPAGLGDRLAAVTWDHATGVRDVARAVAAARAR